MDAGKIKETKMLETIHAHFFQKTVDGGVVLLKTYKSPWLGMADKELDNAKMLPLNGRFFTPIGKDGEAGLYYPFFNYSHLTSGLKANK